ncbi:hypothetical protein SpCBS45565_g02572 [Spizellomyces sp. 'palustris']|nr:hypothetical protein SpCBS45565_g02572 [Spizellomyces sp. 'palustris']
MACSKYEYVKLFEQNVTLLPNTWLVVRVDGHSFHRFTSEHNFAKPNDIRSLQLMNYAAQRCMQEMQDIVLAYGQSDEFSFVFRRSTNLYKRREAKITSTLCSLFTSNFIFHWKRFFADLELKYPPSFDARAVCYPTDQNLRDYMSWRQADCHINNLYNTAFWSLVQDKNNPRTEREAQAILKDTDSAAKNELLFTHYGINYNKLPEIFRKGSTLFRRLSKVTASTRDGTSEVKRTKNLVVEHGDIIGDKFWQENPQILSI